MSGKYEPHRKRWPGLYDAKPGMILRRIKSRAPIPEYIRVLSALANQQNMNPLAQQQYNLMAQNNTHGMGCLHVGFWEGVFG